MIRQRYLGAHPRTSTIPTPPPHPPTTVYPVALTNYPFTSHKCERRPIYGMPKVISQHIPYRPNTCGVRHRDQTAAHCGLCSDMHMAVSYITVTPVIRPHISYGYILWTLLLCKHFGTKVLCSYKGVSSINESRT